jgi:hypothetical protein
MTEITNVKDAESWWASLTTAIKIEVAQEFTENGTFDDEEDDDDV